MIVSKSLQVIDKIARKNYEEQFNSKRTKFFYSKWFIQEEEKIEITEPEVENAIRWNFIPKWVFELRLRIRKSSTEKIKNS